MKKLAGNPTAYQVRLMRHALGLDGKTPYYRNYFAASSGFEDDEQWMSLVEKDLAVLHQRPSLEFPYKVYRVTEKGKQFVRSNDA